MIHPTRGSVHLRLKPSSLREANAFVAKHHRHHKPPRGCKYCIAAVTEDKVVGVAIVGRPLARMIDDEYTCEVLRMCSDGTNNVCSFLYGACARIARAMGYRHIITYTLAAEGGASLRAAGWNKESDVPGYSWSRLGRPRKNQHPTCDKIRWGKRR